MQSSKTQVFLDIICAEVSRKRSHAAIRAELSDHIEDHMLHLMQNRGFSAAEAEDEVLRCMGDPVLLGQQLNCVHCRWKPFILQILTCVLWIAILVTQLYIMYVIIQSLHK